MNSTSIEQSCENLLKRLGVECARAQLLHNALVHRSYSYEFPESENNERLEFLGDAVLGLVVTDMIFAWYPQMPEGDMAKLRSGAVNTSTLADLARSVNLGEDLLLGKGEEISGGRDKDSILADSFEAVLGAIYLDCGLDALRRLVDRLLGGHIRQNVSRGVVRDFKTGLQEVSAQRSGTLPRYEISSTGPDHAKSFAAEVYVDGELLGSGEGRSKKQAEQAAAQQALDSLGGPEPQPDARTS
ncbi:MAG: ribonuclease III [Actinomycetota bacterium]